MPLTLGQTISKRKADIARMGLVPGKASVYWHGWEGNRRRVQVLIPAGDSKIMFITGTCEFDESNMTSHREVVEL